MGREKRVGGVENAVPMRGLFHHHLVLAAVAYLFVLAIYLRAKKNFWCYVGTGAARDAAVFGAADRWLPLLRN